MEKINKKQTLNYKNSNDYLLIYSEIIDTINTVKTTSKFHSISIFLKKIHKHKSLLKRLTFDLSKLQETIPEIELKLVVTKEKYFEIVIFDQNDIDFFLVRYGIVDYYTMQNRFHFIINNDTETLFQSYSKSIRKNTNYFILGISMEFIEDDDFNEMVEKEELFSTPYCNHFLTNEYLDEDYNYYFQKKFDVNNNDSKPEQYCLIGLSHIFSFKDNDLTNNFLTNYY